MQIILIGMSYHKTHTYYYLPFLSSFLTYSSSLMIENFLSILLKFYQP